MGRGVGFGKVILFNEHFVVHGVPGIAAALDKRLVCETVLEPGQGWVLDDLRDPELKQGFEREWDKFKGAVDAILGAAGVDTSANRIRIRLRGDVLPASGMGWSAAFSVALARAVADEFGLNLTDEQIFQLALEGERVYHGLPSGIDPLVATVGGVVWFVKDKPNRFEKLKLPIPMRIVVAYSGVPSDTAKAVAGVRERKEQFKQKYDQIFEEANALVNEAKAALGSGNWERVGELMNRNHRLLQEIEVSCEVLDRMVGLARSAGALGAKLTGGGLGGCVVALTPDEELQEQVAQKFDEAGYRAVRALVGGST